MSYFRNQGAGLDEQDRTGTAPDELLHHEDGLPPARVGFAELAGRVSRWFQGLDPEPDGEALGGETVEHDVLGELDADEQPSELPAGPEPRFALVRYGYSQAEVERRLDELEGELADREREITELREQVKPPPSITEEIERIGEQTASILVVAHDQAHETTRRAQEQAERCIADAAANAVAMTAEAKERLRALDEETDSVWRERERLLEDTRAVSERLATLVEEALNRFPADGGKGSGPEGPDRFGQT